MTKYQFVTLWNIDAPLEPVWDVIEDADSWPEWWRGVLKSVEIKPGDQNSVGSIRHTVWRSAMPYNIEFDSEIIRVERHHLIEAHARGELEGVGLWSFSEAVDGKTRVQYDWTVTTTKRWMNLLAPVAKPFFRWNHDTIMRWGEEGLKRRLGI